MLDAVFHVLNHLLNAVADVDHGFYSASFPQGGHHLFGFRQRFFRGRGQILKLFQSGDEHDFHVPLFLGCRQNLHGRLELEMIGKTRRKLDKPGVTSYGFKLTDSFQVLDQVGDVDLFRSPGQRLKSAPYLLMGWKGKMSPREALLDQGGYLVGTDNTVAKNGFLGVELCFCKLHQVLNICYENCFPRSALSGNGSEPDFCFSRRFLSCSL